MRGGDGRSARGRAWGGSGGLAGGRARTGSGRGRRCGGLVGGGEVELLLHELRRESRRSCARGRGRPARGELPLHELQLGLVLRVVGLARDEDLEHGGSVAELPLRDVGLGELRIGGQQVRFLLELRVDLDQPVQGLHVRGVLLHDLLQERGRAVAVAALDQLLHQRLHLLVGAVELALQEVDARHLHAGVLVARVELEEPLEEGLRLLDLLGAEVGLSQAGHDLRVVGGALDRLLQVARRLVVVLLDEVDLAELEAQPAALGVDLEALLQDLERLRQVSLLRELFRDGDVLLHRLARVALARVEVGQLAADLEVARVDVRHLLEDIAGLAHLAALDVLVDDVLVLALGLHHEALLAVELGQVQVGIERGRIELVDLLPDGDGLEVEAVLGVEVRHLGVLLGRLAELVELGVEVADLVDDVPVARVVLDELLVETDGLLDLARLLELVRFLLDFDGIDLGHPSPRSSPSERPAPGPSSAPRHLE